MKVWIDQDLCTGDAQCVEICPEVFVMREDGSALLGCVIDPRAAVPAQLEAVVLEAAEYCPGECIFVVSRPDQTTPDQTTADQTTR
jgi:ferredoxin